MLNRAVLEINKEQVGEEFIESFIRMGNDSLFSKLNGFVQQKLSGISLSLTENEKLILIQLLDGQDSTFNEEDAETFNEEDAEKFVNVLKKNNIPFVIDRNEQKEYFDNAVTLQVLNTKYSKELLQTIISFQRRNLKDIIVIPYQNNSSVFQFKIVAKEDGEQTDEHLQQFYDLLEVAGLAMHSDYRPDGKGKKNRTKFEESIFLLRKKTNESIIVLTEDNEKHFNLLIKIVQHLPEPRKTGLTNYLNSQVRVSSNYVNTIHDILVEPNYSQDLTLFIEKFPELMKVLLGDDIVKIMQKTGFSNFLTLREMALNLLKNNAGLSAMTRACGVNSSPAGIALLRKMEMQFMDISNSVPVIDNALTHMNKLTKNPRVSQKQANNTSDISMKKMGNIASNLKTAQSNKQTNR